MEKTRALRGSGVASIAALFAAATAAAQTPQQKIQTEIRADAIISRWTSAQGALGISVPTGLYVRTGVNVGAGAGGRGFDSRADLLSRFTLDPFRENRWALYAGGGISERFSQRESPQARTYLLVFLGLDGPLSAGAASGWTPAFEIGFGGGARVGVIIRRGIRGRR